jgi:hypothetical protein
MAWNKIYLLVGPIQKEEVLESYVKEFYLK